LAPKAFSAIPSFACFHEKSVASGRRLPLIVLPCFIFSRKSVFLYVRGKSYYGGSANLNLPVAIRKFFILLLTVGSIRLVNRNIHLQRGTEKTGRGLYSQHKNAVRILHIAPFNVANVPFTFVRAERQLGFDSRLITFGRNPLGYPEDICLDLPLMDAPWLRAAKRRFLPAGRMQVSNVHQIPDEIPPKWRSSGLLEDLFWKLRHVLWRSRIRRALVEVDVRGVDVIQLDGGVEFYRDGRNVKKWKAEGKKIICCYTGSDLRVRGVIPEIDAMADLHVSVEFDHIYFHPDVHHVFFPFDASSLKPVQHGSREVVRIGHAPTNRAAKGTEAILAQLDVLKAKHPIEVVLIEGLPYEKALRLKASCDLFVDQVGDLGYGINALEALAMEIPVATCLVRGFAERYPDHPFIEVNSANLAERLLPYVRDASLRKETGARGREWVRKYHDPVRVVKTIHRLAGLPDQTSTESG